MLKETHVLASGSRRALRPANWKSSPFPLLLCVLISFPIARTPFSQTGVKPRSCQVRRRSEGEVRGELWQPSPLVARILSLHPFHTATRLCPNIPPSTHFLFLSNRLLLCSQVPPLLLLSAPVLYGSFPISLAIPVFPYPDCLLGLVSKASRDMNQGRPCPKQQKSLAGVDSYTLIPTP